MQTPETTSSKLANTKHYKALLNNHERVLTNHINHNTGMTSGMRESILTIYRGTIDHKNIKYFYARGTELFTSALILDKLDIIKDYESYKSLENA